MEHYHYYITFGQGDEQQMDSTPYTDEKLALVSAATYPEHLSPRVVQVNASETCDWPTHRY